MYMPFPFSCFFVLNPSYLQKKLNLLGFAESHTHLLAFSSEAEHRLLPLTRAMSDEIKLLMRLGSLILFFLKK